MKYYISFTSTILFIKGIQNYLKKELKIKNKKIQTRFPDRNNNIRTLNIGGNLKVEKILNHIYDDSTIFLERKYEKYLKLKNINYVRYSKSEN